MHFKQIIFIVTDLKMDKGKTVSQGAHASVQAFMQSSKSNNQKWIDEGMKKIVLKITGDQVSQVIKSCEKNNLNYAVILDAGKTQIEPGSLTAIGIGPEEENKLDALFKNFKLL